MTSVCVWGSNDAGQLGIPTYSSIASPQTFELNNQGSDSKRRRDSNPKNSTTTSTPSGAFSLPLGDIVSVTCGFKHTLVLTRAGTVLTMGSNEFGQLARPTDGNVDDERSLKQVQGLPVTSEVVQVASGWYHSAAITEDGQLYMWGRNSSGQCAQPLSSSPGGVVATCSRVVIPTTVGLASPFSTLPPSASHVVQVACGRRHTLALLRDSRLFAWGFNAEGQLGLGGGSDVLKDFYTPQFVSPIAKLPIRQIACGADHSMALTPTGTLYVWGNNECGQLGVQQRLQRPSSSSSLKSARQPENISATLVGSFEPVPLSQSSLKGYNVVYVAAGEAHTAVLLANGRVFTFGAGRLGQLGNSATGESRWTPQAVQELMGSDVTQIACGRAHTLAFVASADRLYAFGSNGMSQLGVANGCSGASPANESHKNLVHLVAGPWGKSNHISKSSIFSIACGGDHNVILVTSNKEKFSPVDYRVWEKASIGLLSCADTSNVMQTYPRGPLPDKFESMVNIVFGSHACLSASFYTVNEQKNPPILSRKCPGLDLDLSTEVQNYIWRLWSDSEVVRQRLQMHLYDNLLRYNSPNYPNVECLRAFLILATSPLMSMTDVYETFHVPFCRAINSLSPVPQSVLDDWFRTLKPRHLRHLVVGVIGVVSKLIHTHSNKPHSKDLESMQKSLLDFLLKLYEINSEKNHVIPLSTFHISDIQSHIDLERDFIQWLKFNRPLGNPRPQSPDGRNLKQQLIQQGAYGATGNRPSRARNTSHSTTLDVPSNSTNPNRSGSVGCTSHQVRASSTFFYCNYPFLFNGEAKSVLLRAEAILSMQSAVSHSLQPLGILSGLFGMPLLYTPDFVPFFQMSVRRNTLIEDTLTVLSSAERKQLRKPLRVEFVGEEALDEGGLKKEFFILIIREIFNPMYGMFRFYSESRLYWFNERTYENSVMFGLIGQICGLAIYNTIMVDLPFPLALFKKLLGEPPTLEDLKELDPVVGRSLQDVLDHEGDDLEELYALTFEMSVSHFDETIHVPLCPNGSELAVTQENKTRFVQLYVAQVFNKSCQALYDAFHQGFYYIVEGADTSLKLFTPEELQALVVGNEEYDWLQLRKSATYQGEYWDRHPVIQWFWEVLLTEFTQSQKRQFLRFLTGCDRVPITGMSGIKIKIQPTRGGDAFYPVAHTCYDLLDLPIYSSKDILAQRLETAIQHTEGFTIV